MMVLPFFSDENDVDEETPKQTFLTYLMYSIRELGSGGAVSPCVGNNCNVGALRAILSHLRSIHFFFHTSTERNDRSWENFLI